MSIFWTVEDQLIDMTLYLIISYIKLTLKKIFSRVKNGSFQIVHSQTQGPRSNENPMLGFARGTYEGTNKTLYKRKMSK